VLKQDATIVPQGILERRQCLAYWGKYSVLGCMSDTFSYAVEYNIQGYFVVV
jgi:hypothetical protein